MMGTSFKSLISCERNERIQPENPTATWPSVRRVGIRGSVIEQKLAHRTLARSISYLSSLMKFTSRARRVRTFTYNIKACMKQ